MGLARADQSRPICGQCKTGLPIHDGVQKLSATTLHVLTQKASRPAVVDFWAPCCGPRLAFAPTYQQAARELAGRVVLTKLNTAANPDVSGVYQIRGIPTLAVFVNGAEAGRQSGAMPLPALIDYLKRFEGTSKVKL